MAEGRMILRSVSQSRKVNSLSLKAALLWTWCIPWFDVDGYLEVETDFLKLNIVPRRHDISEEEITVLLRELSGSKLWTLYVDNKTGKAVAKENNFNKIQRVRRDHEAISNFTPGELREYDGSPPAQINLNELKLNSLVPTASGRQKVKIENSYPEDSNPYKLSKYLWRFVFENFPKTKKPDLQKWARHVDLMIRVDNRTPDDIGKVIEWAQQDNFWKSNILSTEKLRKQFDNLQAKMVGPR